MLSLPQSGKLVKEEAPKDWEIEIDFDHVARIASAFFIHKDWPMT